MTEATLQMLDEELLLAAPFQGCMLGQRVLACASGGGVMNEIDSIQFSKIHQHRRQGPGAVTQVRASSHLTPITAQV